MQEKSGYRLGCDAANGKSLGVINDVVAKCSSRKAFDQLAEATFSAIFPCS